MATPGPSRFNPVKRNSLYLTKGRDVRSTSLALTEIVNLLPVVYVCSLGIVMDKRSRFPSAVGLGIFMLF